MDEYDFRTGTCVCCGKQTEVLQVTISTEDWRVPYGIGVSLTTDPICLKCIALVAGYDDEQEDV